MNIPIFQTSSGAVKMHLKIGQVAQMVGLSIKRIREYEKEGLVKPVRGKTSNQRMYGFFEIGRIMQTKKLIHERGLTLAGIKMLLNLAPCWIIFGCNNPKSCSVYINPHARCFELKGKKGKGTPCAGNCETCPVYMTRADKIQPLFPEISEKEEGMPAVELA
jgi:hypothetical protein